eukprot:10938951-Karenia_brevis.AAC.1
MVSAGMVLELVVVVVVGCTDNCCSCGCCSDHLPVPTRVQNPCPCLCHGHCCTGLGNPMLSLGGNCRGGWTATSELHRAFHAAVDSAVHNKFARGPWQSTLACAAVGAKWALGE